MAGRQQYRGMSTKEIGQNSMILFTCSVLGVMPEEEEGAADVVKALQQYFSEIFPEGPVILGMTRDLIECDLETDRLPEPFMMALAKLAAAINDAFSRVDDSLPQENDDPMKECYPAVGEAFVDACRKFPEDLDMDDPEYLWDVDDEDDDDEEFTENPLFEFAEEAEEAAYSELTEEDVQQGLELMGKFSMTGQYANDGNAELFAQVEECLDRIYSEIGSGMETLPMDRDSVEAAIREMHPDFAEYFLSQVTARGDKILLFPSQKDAQNRRIRILVEAFVDTFLKKFLTGSQLRLVQQEKLEDPVIYAVMFFGIVGVLAENGYFEYDEDDDDDDDDDDEDDFDDEEEEDEDDDPGEEDCDDPDEE